MTNKTKNIILIGSYGRGNIGDDAFIEAFKNILKDKNVYLNASNDLKFLNLPSNFQVIPTDLYKDFFKKIKIFFRSDTIIYGGGDLWVVLYGDKYPNQSLWKMLIINSFCKLCGKTIYYMGVGAGKLEGLPLALARKSAYLADYILFRDQLSPITLNINPNKYAVTTDLTCFLQKKNIQKYPKTENQKTKIGISLLYFIPDPVTNFYPYLTSIAKSINLLDSNKYSIQMLPFLYCDKVQKNDIWTAKEFNKLLKPDMEVEIMKLNTTAATLEVINKLDLVIGTRLHANILSAIVNTPTIGISYRPKVQKFFNDHQLSNYFISIDNLNELSPKINQVINNPNQTTTDFNNAFNLITKEKTIYEKFITNYL